MNKVAKYPKYPRTLETDEFVQSMCSVLYVSW